MYLEDDNMTKNSLEKGRIAFNCLSILFLIFGFVFNEHFKIFIGFSCLCVGFGQICIYFLEYKKKTRSSKSYIICAIIYSFRCIVLVRQQHLKRVPYATPISDRVIG